MNDAVIRTHVLVWLALLVLLALTLGSAYLRLDGLNAAVNLTIAAIKTALIASVFMRLRSDGALMRLAAIAGFACLALLIGLSLADFLTRAAQ